MRSLRGCEAQRPLMTFHCARSLTGRLSAASEHQRRVAEAARIVAERSAELNKRLA